MMIYSRRRSASAWYDDGADFDTRTVPSLGHPVVSQRDAVDTGLLDKDGNPIFRAASDEIGFYRKDQRGRR